MTRVIAFTGKKRSGKTSLVSAFMAEVGDMGYTAVRVGFKQALLDQVKTHFPDFLRAETKTWGIELDDVDRLLEEKPGNIRQFLQNYGTDLFRNQDANYWTNKWVTSVLDMPVDFVLVDDLRFMNEAAAVKNLGGVIIRIKRPSVGDSDTHQSETEMDLIPADFEITEEDLNLAIHQSNLFLQRAFFESAGTCTDQDGTCEKDERCRCVTLKN
jgi:molybdopterin-guanine dinucleotide biosynthesis protein